MIMVAFLIVDFVIALGVFVFFVYHFKKTKRIWYEIDDEYNRIIFDIYEQRIFLNDVLLSHEQAEIELTFNTLRWYLIIVFDIYRIRIDGFHNTAFEKLSDIRLVGRRWARKSHTTKVLSPDRIHSAAWYTRRIH